MRPATTISAWSSSSTPRRRRCKPTPTTSEKLRDAVRSIEQTQRPTRIEEALALAESLANPVRSTEDLSMQPDDVPADQQRTMVQARGISTVVHVYSDGRFAKLSDATLKGLNLRMAGDDPTKGGLNLRYHMAGKLGEAGNANNLAIVRFHMHRQPADTKKTDAAATARFRACRQLSRGERDGACQAGRLRRGGTSAHAGPGQGNRSEKIRSGQRGRRRHR